MGFLQNLWKKDATKEATVVLVFMIVIYLLRRIVDLFFLTFLFTYLIYNLEKFLINGLKTIININGLFITIILYSLIFTILGYFIYKFIPIIISQSIIIINQFVVGQSQSKINKIEEYLFPLVGNIDINDYIKNEANLVFKFIENIGKWGINIILSLILSLFFMLEKKKIKNFLYRLKVSKFSDTYRYLEDFFNNFLNSFGKVIQVQLLIAITNSILSLIALRIMNFPQLIALGFMIFIFSLIPVAGTIISIIPLSIIAFNIGGIIKVIDILLVVALLHALESYVLNPQFMSIKTRLPVFFVFIVLLISQHFMGIWGLLVGIPLFIFVLDLLKVDFSGK